MLHVQKNYVNILPQKIFILPTDSLIKKALMMLSGVNVYNLQCL